MISKITSVLTLFASLFLSLEHTNAFTIDPRRSNLEAPSIQTRDENTNKKIISANSTTEYSNFDTLRELSDSQPSPMDSDINKKNRIIQKFPTIDSFDVNNDISNKGNDDKMKPGIQKSEFSWYKWIARLRVYKRKIQARKNIYSTSKISKIVSTKYPYTINSKEENEGLQLSLWVNSQVDQLDLIPKKSEVKSLDPETIQKMKVFLKELEGIHEILPSTIALAEIRELQYKLKEKNKIENYASDIKKHDDVWEDQYENLRQFKKINGHCRVPQNHKEIPSLGHWVDRQRVLYSSIVHNFRKRYKGHKIKQEILIELDNIEPKKYRFKKRDVAEKRILKLLEIGFDFQSQSKHPKAKETWIARFYDLIQFYEEHGHCIVPYKYPPNQSLAYWVNNQRRSYKSINLGAHPDLTYAKWKTLDRMNFKWGSEHTDKLWNQRYKDLKEFFIVHGNCDVPYKYSTNPGLGLWVSYQRNEYKQLQSKKELPNGIKKFLDSDRIQALNEINFQWDICTSYSSSSSVHKMEELLEFSLIHDHCDVPNTYIPNQALSDWVKEIRLEYQRQVQFPDNRAVKKNKDYVLTNNLVDQLNSMGFKWC